MKRVILIIAILVIIVSCVVLGIYLKNDKDEKNNNNKNTNTNTNESFEYKIINDVHKNYNKNYMISPLSIGYALSVLNEGATGETKKQIDALLGNYKLIENPNIKDKISLANALFIENKYKNDIKDEYIKTVKEKYNAEILNENVDANTINNWVNEKTYKMIPKIIDDLNEDFVLGIVNAVAIDVEWKEKFICQDTRKEKFTLKDGTTMETAMMHSSKNLTYFENSEAKGIIKQYVSYDKNTGKITDLTDENTVSLEYIAILPNDIDSFMKDFNKTKLDNLLKDKKHSSSELIINLSLPKYTYDFNYDTFKNTLINLGMKDAFIGEKAKFNNIITEKSKLQLYVGEAIHMSHIELSESGTKAAAVTSFMLYSATSINDNKPEVINIKFDKPFIYIIKEKNSDNIWFFGTVYEPMEYSKHNCNAKGIN